VEGRILRGRFPRVTTGWAYTMRRLGLCAILLAIGSTGCRSCGDRDKPRLLDRLFHRDEDGPSSKSARDAEPCDRRAPLLGAPVSYTTPAQAPVAPAGPAFAPDPIPYATPSPAAPANELPLPSYISPQNVPMGPGAGR